MTKLTNKQLTRLLAWQFDISMNKAKNMVHILINYYLDDKRVNDAVSAFIKMPDNSEVINNLRKVAHHDDNN